MACDTVVGLAFMDNFDEITDGLEEGLRPHLIAELDRCWAQFAKDVNGLARKYENDKYIIIMSREDLKRAEKGKVEVLSKIRGIDTNGDYPVTASIGVGCGRATVAENLEDARVAADLALGRGGDQVVVRDNGEFRFFGGVAKEFAPRTGTKARLKANAFAGLVSGCDEVIVLGHKNVDLDCFGAAVGVFKIAESLDKKGRIVVGDITPNVARIYERLIKASEYDGAFVAKDKAAGLINPRSLVVVVDTNRKSMIEGEAVFDKAEELGAKIVLFDHHRLAADSIKNAVMSYHEAFASSTCELITEVMEFSHAAVKLKPAEADALLAGITVDTKNFSIKTGARTFESAAYLKRAGADTVRVKLLFQSDLESYRARSAAVASAEVIHNNIAVSVCSSHVENPQIVAAQAADELLNIDGIEASFVMCYRDGVIIISARSLGAMNVQVIMEKLGGGGHQTVAGAQLSDRTYDDLYEAEETLKAAILAAVGS